MERMTFLNGDDIPVVNNDNCYEEQSEHYCGPAIDRLAAYEDTGLEPEICAEYKKFEDEAIGKGVPFSRIVELMEADKEGRLVVIPCKVGDTVYVIDWYLDCDIDGFKVCDDYEKEGYRACGYCRHNYVKKFTREKKYENQMLDEIGKTVFLTREEAERALATDINVGHAERGED